MSRANRDIPACAILNRRRFPGLESLEQVSGTCARKEGLRILTSPRREASLFKLGRTFGFGQFLLYRSRARRFRLSRQGRLLRTDIRPKAVVHRSRPARQIGEMTVDQR